ncbi:MAG: pyrroline-5-carboxylate reductase [Balneolaceae bacterium]
MKSSDRIAILGAGNIGTSIANGLVQSGKYTPGRITLTRRRLSLLEDFTRLKYKTTTDNLEAIESADTVILSVEPGQLNDLLDQIEPGLDPDRHTLISVVVGPTIRQIRKKTGDKITVVRAMPNTAIAIGESMTCICSDEKNGDAVKLAKSIFETVGETLVILEEQMTAATALCACGLAFFLRSIRAASQGGIEIGFNSRESLFMAAQTAKGAASLLARQKNHPEFEIDRVTTPRGCTISGLNQMEHNGFSSAMIKGILHAAEKAAKLYAEGTEE